jgi:hypothetical protein
VWEVVRDIQRASGREEQRIKRVAQETGLPVGFVRLAIDFYVAFPAEVDARILADRRAADHERELIGRRERLLS